MHCLTILSLYLFVVSEQVVESANNGTTDDTGFLPKWPFENNETLNLIFFVLVIFIVILLLLMFCCICFCCFCRKAQEEELAITPSELIAIGATPSDLKAANISPSVLKESGASYSQMAKLGATPSQLVETGANKKDLVRLGATQSQLSHVGYHQTQQPETKKQVEAPQSEVQTEKSAKVSKPTKQSQKTFKKGSNMSQLATSMAEKLKDKPSKKTKDADTSSAVDTTASSKKPVMSTVSTSPEKRAEALKPTDDSMSMAMGPQEN